MGGRGHTSPSKPKLFTTGSGGSPSKLPIRPIASSRSMPSPFPPAVADKNGASTSRSKNKGKAVDDSSSRNKGKVVDDNSSRNNNYNSGRSGDTGGNIGQANAGAPREQDMFMPIANVTRIMRDILPTHAKISDDAKETMQECLSEYISFVTSEANERCRLEQRKTITAEDLLWSLSKLGFDDQVPPLTLYLQRYREAEGQLARGFLAQIKRTASDAGLYVQQQPAPQYPFMQPLGQYRNPIPPNIPQQPQTFFLRGGDGSSSLAAREQGLMPAPPPMRPNYHRPEAPAYSTGMQVLPAYSDATAYRDITPAPSERDVRVYRGAAGASSSSQAADPLAQQAPFPGSDPYAPNK